MNVCHVSKFLCPRIVKLAYVQKRSGINPYWLGVVDAKVQDKNVFNGAFLASEVRFGGIEIKVRRLRDKVDLFHAHTHLRDSSIAENCYKSLVNVVWDAHDQTFSKYTPDIGANSHIAEHFYRPYCPKDWFAYPKVPTKDLVITTGLADFDGHFRYWYDTFFEISKMGTIITCYTTSKPTKPYETVAVMEEPLEVRNLIKKLSHYRAGLCGSPFPDDNMLHAFPNKLCEYIAAGIPVICLGSQHDMAEFIEEMGIGEVIDDISQLPRALEKIEEKKTRERVIKIRNNFTMETQEKIVRKVYEKIL